MPVQIEFSTANAAFAEAGMSEVALILRQIADQCDGYYRGSPTIRDSNGNTIGRWSATIEADKDDDNPFHPESPEGRAWADGWHT